MSAAQGQVAWMLQAAPAAAAGQPGGGVQDAVAQGLRLGAGEAAVQGEQPAARPAGPRRSGRRPARPCSSPARWRGTGRCRSPCRCGWRLRPGRAPGARRRCRRAGPASRVVARARLVTHRVYRQPSSASNKVSWAPGCGRSRRAKTRIVAGQPSQLVPGRASRSRPVSSVTCASSIQHRGARSPGRAQASSARRSRTSPR